MTTVTANRGDRHPALQRDVGLSLVEVIISVVLLGMAVVAVVTALRVTVTGSAIERDHARSHQLLQSAAGVVQSTARISCEGASGEKTMRYGYQAALESPTAGVQVPDGWGAWTVTVLPSVEVWDGTHYWQPGQSPQNCYEPAYQLQLITLEAKSPDGRIVRTRQVVKDGS